ncbi:ribosome silencing factor [Pseudoalteromonas sp. SR44-5]|uniref:Ribosomal silencing factor RsfS n=1 Tax=Pseudoalteromonas arctica TaxID=394751 RepID=A0A7Y0DSD6_9GAMM|nr:MULTISPECIES: ribosome silencing factor [Pseudoalteromonas]MBB1366609.1 ribosome silencing factor [Pseudoalteromonas sp. SR44-5]MBB1417982.1 ribosome silencing factor [Pseudoalteromonas sp. SG44-1]MBB1481202.1 ribosome silencing factor [Pseudoalteromonas sp. SG41-2]NMM40724.1 ribosome silencing factor [Pseudoalteromonas arctica]
MDTKQLLAFAIDKIDDMKARDVVNIDVTASSDITDFMVVCSGTSKRHVLSIADHLAKEARHAGQEPLGYEGQSDGEWALVDLGDVIVHVMQDQARSYYDLEKLWS